MKHNILDTKPEMKEAFEAVIDAGFIKEHMLDIKRSYNIELVDWTAGIVYQIGMDSAIVYSFTDHKILITQTDNAFIRIDPRCYKGETPYTLFVEQWVDNGLLYCPMNRNGIMFNGKRWFIKINRIIFKEYFLCIGIDSKYNCLIFDLSGNIIFNQPNSNYDLRKNAFIIEDLMNNCSTIYDYDFNVIVKDVVKVYYKKYTYFQNKRSPRQVTKSFVVAETKNNKIFFLDEEYNIIVGNIDFFDTIKAKNGYLDIVFFKRGRKTNFLGKDYSLVFGDSKNISGWIDSVAYFPDEDPSFIKVTRNKKENLLSFWDMSVVFDDWYDEIVPLKSEKTPFKYAAAVADNGNFYIYDIDDVRCNNQYGKRVIDESFDDIFVYKDIIYVEIDGQKRALWRLLNKP